MDIYFFFFFNDTATTEIYTLSLHDALPISRATARRRLAGRQRGHQRRCGRRDRKSTRLNSSHSQISYAVFCLKKKKKNQLGASPRGAHPTYHPPHIITRAHTCHILYRATSV